MACMSRANGNSRHSHKRSASAPQLGQWMVVFGTRTFPRGEGWTRPFWRQPAWSDTESLIKFGSLKEVDGLLIVEHPNDVLRGLRESTVQLTKAIAEAALELWLARRADPALIVQDGGAWAEIAKAEQLAFPGYGGPKLNVVGNPHQPRGRTPPPSDKGDGRQPRQVDLDELVGPGRRRLDNNDAVQRLAVIDTTERADGGVSVCSGRDWSPNRPFPRLASLRAAAAWRDRLGHTEHEGGRPARSVSSPGTANTARGPMVPTRAFRLPQAGGTNLVEPPDGASGGC